MLLKLSRVISKGPLAAILLTTALALLSAVLPPVALLSAASIALVALRFSAIAVAQVTIGSMVVAGIVGSLAVGNPYIGIGYAIGLWLPVAIPATVWRHYGMLVAIVVTLAVASLVVLATNLASSNPEQLWLDLINERLIAPYGDDAVPEKTRQVADLLEANALYLSGMLAFGTSAVTLVALFIGRAMHAGLDNPGGFGNEFRQLSFGTWAMLAISATAALALIFEGPLLVNLIMPMLLIPILQGMAVVHAVANSNAKLRVLVFAMWLALVILPGSPLLVAGIGISDNWLKYRQMVR